LLFHLIVLPLFLNQPNFGKRANIDRTQTL
jgi:hypothetical protein